MMDLVSNHLWQSTLFAAAAALLTLFSRNNHARIRYWIQPVASVKFLIPFSLFVAIGLFNSPSGRAQSQAAPKPSFEVASVKAAADCGKGPGPWNQSGPTYQPGGRYTTCSNLKSIIMDAYEIKFFSPISGIPDWGNVLYKIEAKAEGNPGKEEMHRMVQSLLEERFKLKVHRETHEAPMYSLVVAKGGHKLKPAKDEQGNPITTLPLPDPDKQKAINKLASGIFRLSEMMSLMGPGSYTIAGKPSGLEFTAKAISMEVLTNALYSAVGRRRVIDKTGLTGLYDFQMTYANPYSQQAPAAAEGPAPAAELSAPSIFTALQDQLGLKLIPDKAPLESIVIDSVEKPSEN